MIDPIVAPRLIASLALALLAGILLVGWLRGSAIGGSKLPAGLGFLAAMALVGQVALAAFGANPAAGFLAWQPIAGFVTNTWGGQILLARLVLAVALALLLLLSRSQMFWPISALLAANIVLLPLSGHANSAEPKLLSFFVHGLHSLSVMVWAGAVMVLGWRALRSQVEESDRTLIAAFSLIALGLVATGIATGIAAAWFQVGSFAALFGTGYGRLLLVKSVLVLGVALACANWLRRRYLPSPQTSSPKLALGIEAAMCAAMLAIAAWLSQTIPGRHADVVWPLPFRIDWQMTGLVEEAAMLATHQLIIAGVLALVMIAAMLFGRKLLASTTGLAALLFGSFGVADLFVPAYPTTYAFPDSSYSVHRLMNAEAVFAENCSACHGTAGRGDGPGLERYFDREAVDLTAEHTGEHTSGDMYWWITHGKPDTIMPGVGEFTSEQDRWDLVNYVRLLTTSAQSVEVRKVVEPGRPLLPSIDFGFSSRAGAYRTLRDLEEAQPALVVVALEPGALDRLDAFGSASADIERAGLAVIVVCGSQILDCRESEDFGPNITVAKADADDIARSWSYYRRTPANPDPDNEAPQVAHIEFLVDRFGYVRAKWRMDEDAPAPVESILADVAALKSEGRILPPPEEHLH